MSAGVSKVPHSYIYAVGLGLLTLLCARSPKGEGLSGPSDKGQVGSIRTTVFTGKTHNLHPHWQNQSLRLPSAHPPNLVLTDFLQCYHLQDIREIMWKWLTEAVSSPRSHSNDPHERNNYMFFYEKMEALVEAAWIMNRGTGEITNPARQVKEKEKPQPVPTS